MGTHKDFAIVSVLHRAAADERAKALVDLVNEVPRTMFVVGRRMGMREAVRMLDTNPPAGGEFGPTGGRCSRKQAKTIYEQWLRS